MTTENERIPYVLNAAYRAKVPVLMTGRPGISKSFTSLQVARQLSNKVYSIVLPEDTPVAELRGFYMPASDGHFKWFDGPVTSAIRNGGIVILDELSHLSPEAQTFMHAALDGSPITLPTGETVDKHPDYWAIATQNDGIDTLRTALADRFPIKITVTNPSESVYHYLPQDLRVPAQRQVEAESGSLRPWFAFAKLRMQMPESEAAELLWPGRGQELINAIRMATHATVNPPELVSAAEF